MNEISAMPAAIRDWLAQREELSDMVFYTEYPPVRKAVPLRKVTVAVGIEKIEIDDTFASETDGEFPGENEYCRSALITLRFSIHAPYSMGGEACHRAFADITDCLAFDSGLDITLSGCGEISEDRATDALVLGAYATARANLCPAQSGDIDFPSFIDKTLLCGSHIRNTDIHLSASQQAFLAQPFASGSYYGTGEGTKTVGLGFEPKAAAVFAGDLPAYIQSGAGNKTYFAAGIRGAGTLGITLTANGFTVKNGDSHALYGVSPALNESGIVYSYIALK